jgi:hypothetical protein
MSTTMTTSHHHASQYRQQHHAVPPLLEKEHKNKSEPLIQLSERQLQLLQSKKSKRPQDKKGEASIALSERQLQLQLFMLSKKTKQVLKMPPMMVPVAAPPLKDGNRFGGLVAFWDGARSPLKEGQREENRDERFYFPFSPCGGRRVG